MKKINSKKSRLPKHHTSIETLSIGAFWKVEETGDLGWLFHFPRKMKHSEVQELVDVWQGIIDEYFDIFGISNEYKSILNLKRKIKICEINKCIGAPGLHDSEKMILEKQLESATKSKNEKSKTVNEETLIHVSKYMGFHIDEFKMSVKKFFSILEVMKKEAQKIDGKSN